MNNTTLEIKLVINGKEAIATLQLTDENVKKIGESLNTTSASGVNSIEKLREKYQALQTLMEKSDLGSKQFKDLQAMSSGARHELEAAEAGMNKFGGASGSARMSVVGLSQTLSDSTMFQNGFKMGMMSIGNNLDQTMNSLVNLKASAQATGKSMLAELGMALSGPTGLLLGFSALVAVLQILPMLFKNVDAAATEAAEKGLKTFEERFKNLNGFDKLDTYNRMKKSLEALQEAREKTKQVYFDPEGTATVTYSKEFDENINLLEKYTSAAKKTIQELGALAVGEKLIKDNVVVHRNALQQLNFEIDENNKKLDNPELTAAQITAISLKIDELEKRKAALTGGKGETDKSVIVGFDEAQKEEFEFQKKMFEAIDDAQNNETVNYIQQLQLLQDKIGFGELWLDIQKEINRAVDQQNKTDVKEKDLPLTSIGGIEAQIAKDQKDLAAATTRDQREKIQQRIADHKAALLTMTYSEKQFTQDAIASGKSLYSQVAALMNQRITQGANEKKKALDNEEEKKLAELDRMYAGDKSNQSYIEKKAALEADYAAKKKKIDLEAFEAGKAFSYAAAIINIAESVTKALSSAPPPYSFILAALAAVAGGIQLETIKESKPQGYAIGGVVAGGERIIRVNEDGEEFIVNAEATRNNRALLNAINSGKNFTRAGYGTAPASSNKISTKNIEKVISRLSDAIEKIESIEDDALVGKFNRSKKQINALAI